MKILMVNKFYYIKGGSETYYFALKKKLEDEGHTVIDFSMEDSKNFKSDYSDYFVRNKDYSAKSSFISKVKMAVNIIYSKEAKTKFEQLILNEKPDIVHLHIFQHQISPSILDVCKKYNIPTVYTAHDLKMICLNYKMMHHGKICEDCKDGKLYHCAINRCVKDSFVKSLINVMEGYIHRWRKSYDAIDIIITPSNFYRNKFIEFGIDEDRVVHIPNFLNKEKSIINITSDKKEYYLYFGRLSEEKGIITLIHAMREIDAKLYIVGSGPLKEKINEYICTNNIKNIELMGFMSGQDLENVVGNSKAVIIPSEWYENGPYSAIESLQLGRPIIGADIGGIPELVNNNGFLFRSGDMESLKNAILEMQKLSEDEIEKMEYNSEMIFNDNYTKDIHYTKLNSIYKKILAKKRASYGIKK